MRRDLHLAVTSLLLISTYTLANSIPKFPSTVSQGGENQPEHEHSGGHSTSSGWEDAGQSRTKSSIGQLTNHFSKKNRKHLDVSKESEPALDNRIDGPAAGQDLSRSHLSSEDPPQEVTASEPLVTVTEKEEETVQQQQTVLPPPPPRSKILDIVIAHYAPENTQQMLDYWLLFLRMPKVQELKPYVYVYCQNDVVNMTEDDFRPILQWGGEVIHTANIGRESHAYLEHMINKYNDLANHTLFTQDIAVPEIPARFQMLFEQKTGYLPLSGTGHQVCDPQWLPQGMIQQIYSMMTDDLCPPVGYTSNFQGQFVVSKARIQDHDWWTYKRLMDYLSKESGHWIHDTHGVAHLKDKSNPMFGHILERTWSLAFNCYESWRNGNCHHCLSKGMVDCAEGDCQCFDKDQ